MSHEKPDYATPPAPAAVPVGGGGEGIELAEAMLKHESAFANAMHESAASLLVLLKEAKARAEEAEARAAKLAARLREEEATTADQARGMLQRDEELRKLKLGIGCISELAANHHYFQASYMLLHSLTVDIPAMCAEILTPPASPLGKSEEGRGGKCSNCGSADWEELAPGVGCNKCEGL
jgi:hypothetical protein